MATALAALLLLTAAPDKPPDTAAATTPAPVADAPLVVVPATPGAPVATIVQRQNCHENCLAAVTILTAVAPPAGAPDEVVALACLRNPLLVAVTDTRSGETLRGVFSTTTIKSRVAGDSATGELKIFLQVLDAGPGPIALTPVCPPALRSGDLPPGSRLSDPVQLSGDMHVPGGFGGFDNLVKGVGKIGIPGQPRTFSLRKFTLDMIRAALASGPDLAALSPANWLLKWETTGNRQLIFRSTPPGARLLLDGQDLGLATETPLSIERDSFRGLTLRLGPLAVNVANCRILPQRNLASDGVVDCDLRPKPRQ